MKKAMKKLMAVLLAVAMVCAMAAPVWADDSTTTASTTNTLTIHGSTTGRAYEAYQVFKGKLNNGVLSDIQWGDGVNGEAIRTDSNLPASLQGANTPAELAAKLENTTVTAADVDAFAKVVGDHLSVTKHDSVPSTGTNYTISGLSDGYYFIKDATARLPEGATYSRYMLSILKDETIYTKDTSVKLDKEIYHNDTDSWGVVGDNQIGDTVEFRTITTVPDVTGYTDYTYEIHDTMSSELTSNVKAYSDITIKVGDALNSAVLDPSYYTVTANGNTFTVFVDIIAATNANVIKAGDSLYTYYSGVLNEKAKVCPDGPQQNEAYLVYSNNPSTSGTGKTPEKTVYDWTFKVDVTKVDGTNHSKTLKGAVFALTGTSNVTLNPDANGEPAEADKTKLIKLIANADGSYTVAPKDYTGAVTYTMTTPDNGQISIKGLDDNTEYYLHETKAPDGYNSLTAPVKIMITNNTYDRIGNQIVTQPNVVVNEANAYSGVGFDVENNAGTTLPGTGGIGTTIFYVIGGGLMAAAAILLITKKRMENH